MSQVTLIGITGLVAAAVVFLLTPLQRFAERVAIAAMPNTHNTPEYAVFRKMLNTAWRRGHYTSKVGAIQTALWV